MSRFQPPPTWADPVLVNEATGKSTFNPIWLKWFIELASGLTSSGAGSGTISAAGSVVAGNLVKWYDASGTLIASDGTWGSPGSIGITTPGIVHGTVIKATIAGGFQTSTGNVGYTGTLTPASFVGKTLTIEDGIVTGLA